MRGHFCEYGEKHKEMIFLWTRVTLAKASPMHVSAQLILIQKGFHHLIPLWSH